MNIHKNLRMSIWISIKEWVTEDISLNHGYPFMDIFTDIYWRMSLHGYPCLDINVDINFCMNN